MRLLLPVLAALTLAAPASAQQLVGRVGTGEMELLDRDLNPVAGGPTFPADTAATVLSPDGRRVATFPYEGPLTIRSASSGDPLDVIGIDAAPDVFWPTRSHIVTVARLDGGDTAVTSYDLTKSHRLRHLYTAQTSDAVQLGNVTRVLLGPEHRRWVVRDYGAAGKVRRRVQLTAGSVQLSGDLLLVRRGGRYVLSRPGSPGRALKLPGSAFYRWVGRHFLVSFTHAVRIDRRRLRVVRSIRFEGAKEVTPSAGGLVVDFGRDIYDAGLRRTGGNPDAPGTVFPTLVANGRLYARVVECNDYAESVAIAAARTGRILTTRPGSWTVDTLGGGYFALKTTDEDCD